MVSPWDTHGTLKLSTTTENTEFKEQEPNTYKTAKEKKTNIKLDIKRYNKQKEANLSLPLERIEFCFKGGYFPKGMKLKDLDETILAKMEKSIFRFSGLKIKIEPFR